MAEAVHVDIWPLGAPADALQGLAQDVAVQGFQLGGDEERLRRAGGMARIFYGAADDLRRCGAPLPKTRTRRLRRSRWWMRSSQSSLARRPVSIKARMMARLRAGLGSE